jgi:hypothetical protein
MADDRPTQGCYLAEVFAPDEGPEQQHEQAERIREVAEGLARRGTPVRCLESLFVPGEEMGLYLFQADRPAVVEHVLRDAGLQAERISPATVDRRAPRRALRARRTSTSEEV